MMRSYTVKFEFTAPSPTVPGAIIQDFMVFDTVASTEKSAENKALKRLRAKLGGSKFKVTAVTISEA